MQSLVDLPQLFQSNRSQWLIGQLLNLAVLDKMLPSLLPQSQKVDESLHKANQMYELAYFIVTDYLQL